MSAREEFKGGTLAAYAEWLMPDSINEKRGASTLDAFEAGYQAGLEAAAKVCDEKELYDTDGVSKPLATAIRKLKDGEEE